MKKAPIIVASVLIALLVGTGIGKLKRAKPIRHNLQAVEVSPKWWDTMAILEFLLAAGLAVGLFVPPLGILVSIGVMLYFAGAVIAHLTSEDANVVPSGLSTLLSALMVKMMINRKRG